MIKKRKQSGFSLLEVMVAIFLISFLLIAIVSLVNLSLANTLTAKSQGAATKYAKEEMERIRALRDRDGLFAIDCFSPTQCSVDVNLGLTPVPEVINNTYTRYYQTQDTPNCQITSTPGPTPTPGGTSRRGRLTTTYVTWQDRKGNHQSASTSCLTDWQQL